MIRWFLTRRGIRGRRRRRRRFEEERREDWTESELCARRKEAFGYDGDKFEPEDFAAENCEYVGSVWGGIDVREGVGGRVGGGKRPGCFSRGLISLVVVAILVFFFLLPPSFDIHPRGSGAENPSIPFHSRPTPFSLLPLGEKIDRNHPVYTATR